MATEAQINANRENATHSTGPQTPEGLAAAARNNFRHGLVGAFTVILGEDQSKFDELKAGLHKEHQPITTTEIVLVESMAQHHWLTQRALALQSTCFTEADPAAVDDKKLALYMRYRSTHERAFYKALNELQKLRKLRTQEQIGFERQEQRKAAEARRIQIHEIRLRGLDRKEELEKLRLAKLQRIEDRDTVVPQMNVIVKLAPDYEKKPNDASS